MRKATEQASQKGGSLEYETKSEGSDSKPRIDSARNVAPCDTSSPSIEHKRHICMSIIRCLRAAQYYASIDDGQFRANIIPLPPTVPHWDRIGITIGGLPCASTPPTSNIFYRIMERKIIHRVTFRSNIKGRCHLGGMKITGLFSNFFI